MDDLYQIASNREREELARFFARFDSIKDIFYTDGNVVYDAIINSSILVETKIRDISDYIFEMVKKDGVILEKDKYTYLNKKKDELGMSKIFYIMFFPKQQEILLYDLAKVDLKESVMKMNKTTYSFSNNKVNKNIYLLDYKQGKSYTY